jgi:hypothetical protein
MDDAKYIVQLLEALPETFQECQSNSVSETADHQPTEGGVNKETLLL